MSVVQRDVPCWVVRDIPTKPYQYAYPEPDWHFNTHKEAVAHLGEVDSVRIAREDRPCWLAKCSRCAQTLGGDDFDEAHYDSRSEAEFHEAQIDDHCDLEQT